MADRHHKNTNGRTVAIVGSGALLLWLLLRGKRLGIGQAQAASVSAADQPAKRPAPPCRVRIDGDGIEVDGERADVPTATARCRVAGAAEVRATGAAITGVIAEIVRALQAAGVRVWAAPEVWSAAAVVPGRRSR